MTDSTTRSFCPLWLTSVTVRSDGTLTACEGWRGASFGDWRTSGFQRLWSRDEWVEFRSAHASGMSSVGSAPHGACAECLADRASHLVVSSGERPQFVARDVPERIVFETPLSSDVSAYVRFVGTLPEGISSFSFGSEGGDPFSAQRTLCAVVSALSERFPSANVVVETDGQTKLSGEEAASLCASGVSEVVVVVDGSCQAECEASHGANHSFEKPMRFARSLRLAREKLGRSRKKPLLTWAYTIGRAPASSVEEAREKASRSSFDRIAFRPTDAIPKRSLLACLESGQVFDPPEERATKIRKATTKSGVSLSDFVFVTDSYPLYERLVKSTLGVSVGPESFVDVGIHARDLSTKWDAYVSVVGSSESVCFVLNHSDCELYDHAFETLVSLGKKILVLDYTDLQVDRDDVPGELLVLRAQALDGTPHDVMPYVPGSWDQEKHYRRDPKSLADLSSDLFFAGQMQEHRYRSMFELFERARVAGLRADFRWTNAHDIEAFLTLCGDARCCFDTPGYGLLCYRMFETMQAGIPVISLKNRAKWYRRPPDDFFADDARDLIERVAKMTLTERVDMGERGREFFRENYSRDVFRSFVEEKTREFF